MVADDRHAPLQQKQGRSLFNPALLLHSSLRLNQPLGSD